MRNLTRTSPVPSTWTALQSNSPSPSETNFSSASDAKTKKYEAFSNCILKSQGENSVDEVLKNERSYEQGILDSEVTIKYLIDLSRESQEHEDRLLRFRKPQKVSDFFR